MHRARTRLTVESRRNKRRTHISRASCLYGPVRYFNEAGNELDNTIVSALYMVWENFF